jgi:hypothetical protein
MFTPYVYHNHPGEADRTLPPQMLAEAVVVNGNNGQFRSFVHQPVVKGLMGGVCFLAIPGGPVKPA